MEVPIETLKEIQNELPTGAQTEIAELTNYSKEYVSMVFHGRIKINKDNIKILNAAQRIILKDRQLKEYVQKTINNILKK